MKHYKSFVCEYCGKVFTSYMKPKYCSDECKRAKHYRDMKAKAMNEKLSKYLSKGENNVCG